MTEEKHTLADVAEGVHRLIRRFGVEPFEQMLFEWAEAAGKPADEADEFGTSGISGCPQVVGGPPFTASTWDPYWTSTLSSSPVPLGRSGLPPPWPVLGRLPPAPRS